MDGLEVTRPIREWSKIPIIVLSARGQEKDKIAALDAGADDYLTKPFGVGELLARMRVALRHANDRRGRRAGLRRRRHHAWISPDARSCATAPKCTSRRSNTNCSPTLVKHAGKVLTHRHLLKEVWGINAINQTHYLRVYMTQLRHKLEADPTQPRLLLTEPGVGYRLASEK